MSNQQNDAGRTFQVRTLTHVELSIHQEQQVAVLYLEAREVSELHAQTMLVALTPEQATSLSRSLEDAAYRLSQP